MFWNNLTVRTSLHFDKSLSEKESSRILISLGDLARPSLHEPGPEVLNQWVGKEPLPMTLPILTVDKVMFCPGLFSEGGKVFLHFCFRTCPFCVHVGEEEKDEAARIFRLLT